MAQLAREEVAAQTQVLDDLVKRLKVLLLPRDPLDDRNIMLEVRPPTSCPHICCQKGSLPKLPGQGKRDWGTTVVSDCR